MKHLIINLAKTLLRATLNKAVRQGLPAVFKRLDGELPLLQFNNAPPSKIRGIIGSAIADASGKRATSAQIEAIIGLYDPTRAALRGPR